MRHQGKYLAYFSVGVLFVGLLLSLVLGAINH